MRICYVANGKYVHTYRWMRFFKERGHDVHLISYAPLEARDVEAVREAGAKYHGDMENFHLKRFWLTLRTLRLLRGVLRRERIDVLHSHFLGANSWYAALSGFRPFVLTVMGGDVTGPDWRPGEDLRESLLTPYTLRSADLITCWSHQLTEVVKRYVKPDAAVEVIHGGVDLGRFSPGEKPAHLLERWGLPRDAKVVLSPRMMRPLYNLDKIAEAARTVCEREPRAFFLFAYMSVATDEAYEREVKAIVERGGINERVRFIGGIPHEEMADHLRLADLVVSIPKTDGTPLSVLEAMACSTPVVTSDIADYDPHYIEPGETVLAADASNSQAVADAALRFLREPELARRISEEARRRVAETASYESQMSRMESLYRHVSGKE